MKLCMGCMNQIDSHAKTCPHCGFNEESLEQESYYLTPGTIIAEKYIVGKVLNYGGHTVSYLGWDAELSRKVIVKEYLPSDFSTRSAGETEVAIYSGDALEQFETGLTNFLNEANRVQRLGMAEGIARVYDCIAENETGYVISEYVEGRSLQEILDQGKIYTAGEVQQFAMQLLSGLARVHPMDIIHCDISPETIMITNDGKIKLTDFGSTRYVTTANSRSLAIILKQGYAPEEQYRSQGGRGPWTDVYAVAAVMYRMLTGKIPQESIERALEDHVEDPSKLGIEIAPGLENALMNAFNVYASDRTQNAGAFLKELQDNKTVRRKVKIRKKNNKKFPIWAAGLLTILLCIAVAGSFLFFRQMQDRDVRNEGATSNMAALQDLLAKHINVTEAQRILEEDDYFKDIQLEVQGYQFDMTQKKDTIAAISYKDGSPLTAGKDLNEYDETELEAMGLQKDRNGHYQGTLYCKLYRDDVISCQEILDCKNAFVLANKMQIPLSPDADDSAPFKKLKDLKYETKPYFGIHSIKTAEGEIAFADLSKEPDKEINVSDIESIAYYAVPFYKWTKENLKSYVGNHTSITDIDLTTYVMKDETTQEESGKRDLLTGKKKSVFLGKTYAALADEGYKTNDIISIDNLEKNGNFVKGEYSTWDGVKKEDILHFNYVTQLITTDSSSAEGLKEELVNQGIPEENIYVDITMDYGPTTEPDYRFYTEDDEDADLTYFDSDLTKVKVEIDQTIHKDPPVPSGGGSGGGSSGGSGGSSGAGGL